MNLKGFSTVSSQFCSEDITTFGSLQQSCYESFHFISLGITVEEEELSRSFKADCAIALLSVQENVSKNLERGVQGKTDSKATSL